LIQIELTLVDANFSGTQSCAQFPFTKRFFIGAEVCHFYIAT